ncbi:hypothetical protein XELAEV_18015485mg [Xenopus laevis]|uniref:Uncharacterized protein n=1 Tax=Xenopus laevis TaxID=8355 RepID=A0A974DJR1_XENLA|nr:hypothetical protein XELAEV_18015485mg [Xenopus laevis]
MLLTTSLNRDMYPLTFGCSKTLRIVVHNIDKRRFGLLNAPCYTKAKHTIYTHSTVSKWLYIYTFTRKHYKSVL